MSRNSTRDASSVRNIRTRFVSLNGTAWKKITDEVSVCLDEKDKIPIYGFACHLQRRNLETLRFIKAESAQFKEGMLDGDLTEEREMHEWISASATMPMQSCAKARWAQRPQRTQMRSM